MLERAGIAVIVALHYAYLAYLLAGGYLAWRWPRTILLHVLAAAWAVVISTAPAVCPLTWAQDWLRHRLGQPSLHGGFIRHYVTGVLYPTGWTWAAQLGTAVVVLVSWVGYARRSGLRTGRVGRRTSRAPRTP